MESVRRFDPDIYSLIKQEEKRQSGKIRLIASENYVSDAILQATGSILTNKYSEGYAHFAGLVACELHTTTQLQLLLLL